MTATARFSALILGLSVSGCALAEQIEALVTGKPQAVQSEVADAPTPIPPPKPEAAKAEKAEQPQSALLPPAETRQSPKPVIVGMTPQEVGNVLGSPSEEVEANPGKVWRYQTAECVLRVDFFFDVKRSGFFALEYTRDDTQNGPESGERCLEAVWRDKQKSLAETS